MIDERTRSRLHLVPFTNGYAWSTESGRFGGERKEQDRDPTIGNARQRGQACPRLLRNGANCLLISINDSAKDRAQSLLLSPLAGSGFGRLYVASCRVFMLALAVHDSAMHPRGTMRIKLSRLGRVRCDLNEERLSNSEESGLRGRRLSTPAGAALPATAEREDLCLPSFRSRSCPGCSPYTT